MAYHAVIAMLGVTALLVVWVLVARMASATRACDPHRSTYPTHPDTCEACGKPCGKPLHIHSDPPTPDSTPETTLRQTYNTAHHPM